MDNVKFEWFEEPATSGGSIYSRFPTTTTTHTLPRYYTEWSLTRHEGPRWFVGAEGE